ncbi:GNAT family N-acetyltransferase [Companilactobacillus sp.]|jgi:ribosomal protein S18 acetylase RimI-like enzyme|uniref:GNAT family N-acetyltransferase n=1 Tax=Companilactobacillus sp. TaxID=2767905 RepID=UPI0025BD3424|nr:GNAT family N-acetyltransferase [Companilactobacillus sp.]MCH4009412.1 GNAT family N-acetyltransferase [Companilactobacillus sp.]MCH4050409.1 GNAT family N-acetyltransferase [Companilactobacillus sp.]MCH4077354.1 GNAT family N-acetyltransferase [Companilactobacillus sp.]MCH4125930.1 GNAT family N-acetyltransferase [Companilactobacillus sp.]MCI1311639.1 GNAT family N-acetyltransferase [Companilactobacillus sp.]
MKIKTATSTDLPKIMTLIQQAQAFFKAERIDQWQNGYPSKEVIMTDISNQECFVAIEDRNIVGSITLTFLRQPEYDNIQSGTWNRNGDYETIHRLAVDNDVKGHGIGSKLLDFAWQRALENDIHSLRTDTHEKNIPMQKLLSKQHFEKIGIIQRPDICDLTGFERWK